jgi:hypothetical protein
MNLKLLHKPVGNHSLYIFTMNFAVFCNSFTYFNFVTLTYECRNYKVC